MGICYIVGAVPFGDAFRKQPGDLVIAADGGYRLCLAKGITPDMTVGDFDSGEKPAQGEVVAFPRRKDETDAALAVKEGIKRGYTVFVFYGCEGGKPDHAYANTQLLYHLAREGFYGYLVGEETIATALVNRSFRFKPEGRVSVFALTERAKGVTIKGLSYSLTDAELQNDVPLGVSNAATGEEAEITVRDGALLLYWEK